MSKWSEFGKAWYAFPHGSVYWIFIEPVSDFLDFIHKEISELISQELIICVIWEWVPQKLCSLVVFTSLYNSFISPLLVHCNMQSWHQITSLCTFLFTVKSSPAKLKFVLLEYLFPPADLSVVSAHFQTMVLFSYTVITLVTSGAWLLDAVEKFSSSIVTMSSQVFCFDHL